MHQIKIDRASIRRAAVALGALLLTAQIRAAMPAEGLEIDAARGEIRVQGVVQKTEGRPAHTVWGKKSTAFVGAKGGSMEKDFMIVLNVDRSALYRAAKDVLGWKTGRRYGYAEALKRKGLTAATKPENYMSGDPVLCALEFAQEGATARIPLEDAIRARVKVGEGTIEKPWTPHFVFTGAGEEFPLPSGCVFCPSDCAGAIITDNAGPAQTELEEYLIDWSKLPEPGASVTVILRSIR